MAPAPDEDEDAPGDTAEKIKEEELQVRRVQDWWSAEPTGPPVAAHSRILSVVEASVVADVIAAGGAYHNILSADRLDALHRQVGTSTDPALEPLRKALQARGGSKAQARTVGMLLFREARTLLERSQQGACQSVPLPSKAAGPVAVGAVATPSRSNAPSAAPTQGPRQQAGAPPAVPAPPRPGGAASSVAPPQLDEAWWPPRRYVQSEAYPAGALMAARGEPDPRSEIVARLPDDFAYIVRGLAGEYLEVELGHGQGVVYVPHSIGGQVLLVPAQPPVDLDEAFHPPQRWGRAEGYPEGAQMAAKEAPSSQSKQLAVLSGDSEYLATGRVGSWLQVALDIEGVTSVAYVLHMHGDLVLLRPVCAQVKAQDAPSNHSAGALGREERVEAMEAKLAQQAEQIQALQAEMASLRAQLGAAAAALAPVSAALPAGGVRGAAPAVAAG